MDVYNYLKMDHKKVAKLFELYKTSPTERNQLEIIKMIINELTLHAESEEAIFYKKLEEYNELKECVNHAEEEHLQMKNKLQELSNIQAITAEVDQKVMQLKNIVDHHVKEEENEIFKQAKKVIDEKETCILKEKIHDYKEKMLHEELI